MPQHTPGPWAVTPNDHARVVAPATADRPYSVVVAECPGYQEPREANARLIAEAPTMRDLVQRLADRLQEEAGWGADFAADDEALVNEARDLLGRINA